MNKDESGGKIAKIIAAEIETNFMRVARLLRRLQEKNPQLFLTEAKYGGLKRRHAYALARIAQQFDGLGIPDVRLHNIGWTKLAVVGRYLTDKNIEQLLMLAEQFTTHELEGQLRGEKPKKGARAMLLHLLPKDDKRFRSLLVEYGAKSSGNGLIGKERALVALLDDIDYLILTHRMPTASHRD